MDSEFSPEHLGLALHTRLVNGDPTASAEIAEIFLPLVVGRLAHHVAHDPDPHTAQQAAIDALVSYIQRPEQYNPNSLGLLAFLVMSAIGDQRNAADSARRRANHELEWGSGVAKGQGSPEYETEHADESDFVARIIENESNIFAWLADRIPSVTDRSVVELMLEGVRRTEAYAIVLDITQLPLPEQVRLVKQHKDRLKARLRRSMDPETIRAEARAHD